jgi:hypothetical protein
MAFVETPSEKVPDNRLIFPPFQDMASEKEDNRDRKHVANDPNQESLPKRNSARDGVGNGSTKFYQRNHGDQKLEEAAGEKGIFWALLLFVGIPLPGTGAWTGTLAASILDWDFKRSILAVMLGVVLAGLIMGSLSLLFGLDTFAH